MNTSFSSLNTLVMILTVTLISSNANADLSAQGMAVYTFKKSEPVKINVSRSLMKKYIPHEPTDKLEKVEKNISRYVSHDDVNTTFEHNVVTGDISFSRDIKLHLEGPAPKLPSKEEAIRQAKSFLDKNKLMPQNPHELKLAHVGGIRSTSIDKDGKPGPIVDRLVTLHFSRELDGIQVIGPGSKIIVKVGEGGNIVGMTRRWRELAKPTKLVAADFHSEKEARAMANRQILSEFGADSKIDIYHQTVAYFDNNGKTIQPVFVFQAKIQLADKHLKPIDYVSIIPAMKHPTEKLNLLEHDPAAINAIKSGSPELKTQPDKTAD